MSEYRKWIWKDLGWKEEEEEEIRTVEGQRL
jgi:hypothetical protein